MSAEFKVFWQRYGLTALLAGSAVVTAGVIGLETDWGRAIRPVPPAATGGPKGAEMVAVLPGFSLQSLDAGFKESAERPLFSPTRRPPSAIVANVPVMKKGQFKLTGTSVNADRSTVFLLETASGKTHYLAKGKEINGIMVDIIEERRVVLKQGEETEELTLRVAASPARPPAPPSLPGAVPGAPPGMVPPPQIAQPGVPTMPSVQAPGFGTRQSAGDAGRYPIPQEIAGAVTPGGARPVGTPGTPAVTPAQAAEAAATAQRRRRFQSVPQQ